MRSIKYFLNDNAMTGTYLMQAEEDKHITQYLEML